MRWLEESRGARKARGDGLSFSAKAAVMESGTPITSLVVRCL